MSLGEATRDYAAWSVSKINRRSLRAATHLCRAIMAFDSRNLKRSVMFKICPKFAQNVVERRSKNFPTN
jgi:hypothetical protein